MKTLYSALYGDSGYPFNSLLDEDGVVEIATHPEDLVERNSALVIWGGSDIDPAFYGHPKHRTTYTHHHRDMAEWALLNKAIEVGIPIIGVCRGAQMLCAKAGGWLIQNVRGHAGSGHEVVTRESDYFEVNSIHHQMMAGLEEVDHELLVWSPKRLGSRYGYKDDQEYTPPENWVEPEFVYFPKIKGFAVQWHPEAMSSGSQATQYVNEYILNKMEELVNVC